MSYDALNAVTGPYASYIFETLLGAEEGTVLNKIPLPDFACITKQHLFRRMLEHDTTQACLIDGALAHRTIKVESVSGEEENVCVDFAYEVFCIRTDIGEGMNAHLTARREGADVCFRERNGSFCATRDDNQILLTDKIRHEMIRAA